jgi:sugar phosphate permease
MKSVIIQGWIVFSAACSLFVISQFYKSCMAVITPQLMADLSLGAKGLGLVSAAFYYTFALTQLPMGVYLDRIGPRITMTVLSLISVAGVVIFAFSYSLTMSVIGRALLGVGMACNLMGTFKLLTLWFSPLRFATLSTTIVSIGAMGTITSSTPLVLLVETFGWRHVFVGFGVLTLITTVIFYLVVRDKSHETPYGVPLRETSKRGPAPGLGTLFRNKDYWIISVAAFARLGIFFAFQGLWAGPYLMQVMELSPVKTGNLILILNIGFILGGPFFGMMSDRVMKTRKWIITVGLNVLFLHMLIMALLPPGTGLLTLTVLFFSFGIFGSSGMVMYTQIKELMPPDMSGTALAGINFFGFVGAAGFLHGVGNLMHYLYPDASFGPEAFKIAFLVCAACFGFVSILYMFTTDTKGGAPVQKAMALKT